MNDTEAGVTWIRDEDIIEVTSDGHLIEHVDPLTSVIRETRGARYPKPPVVVIPCRSCAGCRGRQRRGVRRRRVTRAGPDGSDGDSGDDGEPPSAHADRGRSA